MLWVVRLLFRGHSFSNVASWIGIVYWMWRWWLFYLDISSLLYLHVSDVFHSALSFGAGGQVRQARGSFVPRASQMMGLSIFHPQTFVHMLGLDWCTNGPLLILGLSPWALGCIQILPSHNYYYYYYYYYIYYYLF